MRFDTTNLSKRIKCNDAFNFLHKNGIGTGNQFQNMLFIETIWHIDYLAYKIGF